MMTERPRRSAPMASPFPGMDPFLEDPKIFPNLHQGLIFCLGENLQGRLPEPYYAATGQREWLEIGRRYVEPDVQLHRPNGDAPPRSGSTGGVAVATLTQTPPL